MSDEEKATMCAYSEKGVTFIEALQELDQLAEGYCLFDGLQDMLAALDNREDDEEEEDEE